jgi:hypothetical protein
MKARNWVLGLMMTTGLSACGNSSEQSQAPKMLQAKKEFKMLTDDIVLVTEINTPDERAMAASYDLSDKWNFIRKTSYRLSDSSQRTGHYSDWASGVPLASDGHFIPKKDWAGNQMKEWETAKSFAKIEKAKKQLAGQKFDQ